ncbi:ABC transporter permease subunit [Halorubrum sp. JWXQ-INN 858]|uniref:ABC transporter permease n=1 Tax=Halorubrum sp. JWXQ-INN 858 TaxID=2690782 RepID=UPI0013588013|nr:ABC transporter permease [Halorubrum sp. JWXQ-INN 858]MWV66006.1 ABC transporter permease subunit [Halorubrum sp. JWXQ-INN 858]
MAIGEQQTQEDSDGGGDGVEANVGWRYTLDKIKSDATARFGLYVIAAVATVAIVTTIDANLSRLTLGRVEDFALAESVWYHPERHPDPGTTERRMPPFFVEGGSLEHPLGTDRNGRDYISRLVYGTRISFFVGIVATALGMLGGVLIGAVSGYYGGWIDDVLMRAVETLYAIPPLVLVIVFTVFVSGGDPDITYAVFGVGIAFIPVFARLIRSRVLSVREMDYVEAARATGVKDRDILRRHVIPNSFAPVLVLATLQIGVTILIVAGLSFLGYGAQPPTPDWGEMLRISHQYMHSNPWMSIWPGLAILITIMGFNLFGDGLQDALDPRIK